MVSSDTLTFTRSPRCTGAVSLPCVQGTLLLTAIYRCGVFSFHIVNHDCWSVNVGLNLWDGLGTPRLLRKRSRACGVMDIRHLITTQMIVIWWSPYKENVPLVCSSRWRVCAYGLYVRAIARTRTNLYCACSRWYYDWEQRKWTALYVPACKISNSLKSPNRRQVLWCSKYKTSDMSGKEHETMQTMKLITLKSLLNVDATKK